MSYVFKICSLFSSFDANEMSNQSGDFSQAEILKGTINLEDLRIDF